MVGRLEEAIKLAQEQGHYIKIYKRKDGGVRVTEIDGVKFSGSSGNKALRSLTGAGYLTKKQKIALRKNRKRVSKTLSKEEAKIFDKINKQRKKAGLKPIKKVTARKARYRTKSRRGSKKKFYDMLSRMAHAVIKKLGFAEAKNVQAFIAQLQNCATTPNANGQTYEFEKTITYLNRNMLAIKDSSLMDARAIAYDWQLGYIEGAAADNEMVDILTKGTKELEGIVKTYNEDILNVEN